jgi:hypothetical protein
MSRTISRIEQLPDEILFDIFLRLDIPELHALSFVLNNSWHRLMHVQTSRRLRSLATDPYLHSVRLHQHCPMRINSFLPLRPAIYDLISRHIIISPHLHARQYDLSRRLHRQLITSRLRKRLERRPSATDLVRRHVLPSTTIAPALVSRSQSLEKEMYRRSLETKISKRPRPEEVRFLGVEWEEERVSVKGLVRRFSCLDMDVERGKWKWRIGISKESPTRAAVWRLRNFWEKVSMGV